MIFFEVNWGEAEIHHPIHAIIRQIGICKKKKQPYVWNSRLLLLFDMGSGCGKSRRDQSMGDLSPSL
ncbi:hypothetical protein [Peribacillus simplex]|uniref:hypothetical protein n=1 Tax=Peribacillus simplex TaxID=1478 RepID=UPI000AB09D5D|nr:hypothetical protein [Peribacillus simplex]